MQNILILMSFFVGKPELKIHKERNHQDESLRTCNICFQIFQNRCLLYKHYISDHPNDNCPVEIDGKYVFQCEYCQKILSSLEAQYTHIKLTHKIRKSITEIKESTQTKCQYCEKLLNSGKGYIDHLVNDHPDKVL